MMAKRHHIVAMGVVGLCLPVISAAASAAVIAVTTGADAFVNQTAPDNNFGTTNQGTVQNRSTDAWYLVKFDLSSLPGDTASISDISLSLSVNDSGTVDMYLANADGWTEGTKNNAAASPGEVTWNNKPGLSTFLGNLTTTAAGIVTVSANADLLAAAQAAWAGDKVFTVILTGTSSTGHDTLSIFARERTNSATVVDPAVTVTTVVPEPTSMAVWSLAGIGLLGRRQRK